MDKDKNKGGASAGAVSATTTLTSTSSLAQRNKSGNLSQRTNRGLKRIMSVTSGSVAPKSWEQASENEKRHRNGRSEKTRSAAQTAEKEEGSKDFVQGSIYEDNFFCFYYYAAETPRSDNVQSFNQANGRSGLIYSRSEGTGSKVPTVVPNSTVKAHRGSNFVPDSAQRHRRRNRERHTKASANRAIR